MNTLALWKRDFGKIARVRIEPDELAIGYDETKNHCCEFQVISANGDFGRYERVRLSLEPGAVYAVLPNLRDGERVRLRLQRDGKTWESRHFINPFVGGVRLEEQL
jgi:hypothetical protein